MSIRRKLSKNNVDLLNDYLEKRKEQSYIKFYNGKVVDNNDPEQIGRCRIRVFGVYGEDIPITDLPWAVPDFQFIGSSVGSFIVPPNDAIVKVYFENDDIYNPKYTTKILDSNNLPQDRTEDYPNTMVFFETDEGEYFKINRKTNETVYHTASGLTIVINSDGDVEIDSTACDVGNINITSKGDTTIQCTSGTDSNVYIGGNSGAGTVGVNPKTEKMAMGETIQDYLDKLITVFQTWVPVPADGGASLKTALLAFKSTTHDVYKDNLISDNMHVNKTNNENE